MSRRKTVVIMLIAALPVLAGVVAWLVETDEEAIERVTQECRRAFLDGDVDAVLSRLTEDAEGEGLIGSGPLAPRVRHWADRMKGRIEDVSASLRKIVVEGDDAHATWGVQVRAKDPEWGRGMMRILLDLTYRRVSDEWRVCHADVRPWSL